MSEVKTKTIAFRVTPQDYDTLCKLADYLQKKGDIEVANPHLLAKQYVFAFANIVLKMHGLTESTDQDNAIFALAKGMAETINPGQSGGDNQ